MQGYRVVALPQATADEVRRSLRAPGYGHPAHVEVARGYGPCRLCLKPFRQGEEQRLLFTYNPFPERAIPCPGPIFVHNDACVRHEGEGFPAGLLGLPLTLEGYDERGLAVQRVAVAEDVEAAVADLLAHPQVTRAHIRNTEAGCFIASLERLRP